MPPVMTPREFHARLLERIRRNAAATQENTMPEIRHPLSVGTRLQTVNGATQGDWDEDDDGTERRARPGETGETVSANHYESQGWTYGVVFDECKAWVFLEEAEIGNPAQYLIIR